MHTKPRQRSEATVKKAENAQKRVEESPSDASAVASGNALTWVLVLSVLTGISLILVAAKELDTSPSSEADWSEWVNGIVVLWALAFGVRYLGSKLRKFEKIEAEKREAKRARREEVKRSRIEKERSEALVRKEEQDVAEERAGRVAERHKRELLGQRRKLIKFDAYGGVVDRSRWERELQFFVSRYVFEVPEGGISSFSYLLSSRFLAIAALDRISDLVESWADEGKVTGIAARFCDVDPVGAEHVVAEILRQAGWDVRVTRASGDQGVDVIAVHHGFVAVFQVKQQQQAVGNKAVQEIIAGKIFENATGAAVVSNAPFTRSAEELARSGGVLLLDPEALSSLLPGDFPT